MIHMRARVMGRPRIAEPYTGAQDGAAGPFRLHGGRFVGAHRDGRAARRRRRLMRAVLVVVIAAGMLALTLI